MAPGERLPLTTMLASRVLVIDDEQANLDLLHSLLEREGYREILCVVDGRKALDTFVSFEPDIVLLDLMMPSIDGYAVLEGLSRLRSAHTFIPVIVLTADASLMARRRALALGANDFVSKPFDLVEVGLRILNLLEVRWLYKQLEHPVRPSGG